MSDRAHSQGHALTELARLVRALGEELAGYRKRALSAEARLRALDQQTVQLAGVTSERVLELERENAELRRRVSVARARTELMLQRLSFLKQQRESSKP